jgi:hypothetical protein
MWPEYVATHSGVKSLLSFASSGTRALIRNRAISTSTSAPPPSLRSRSRRCRLRHATSSRRRRAPRRSTRVRSSPRTAGARAPRARCAHSRSPPRFWRCAAPSSRSLGPRHGSMGHGYRVATQVAGRRVRDACRLHDPAQDPAQGSVNFKFNFNFKLQ